MLRMLACLTLAASVSGCAVRADLSAPSASAPATPGLAAVDATRAGPEALVANLQFEMIGRPDPKVPPGTLWLTGYERSTLGPQLASGGARLVQDPHPDQRFFERSDNIQFARRGVVAHTVSSYGLHKEYHQASDEIRHINLAHMRDAIASLVEPVRRLAESNVRPTWNEGLQP